MSKFLIFINALIKIENSQKWRESKLSKFSEIEIGFRAKKVSRSSNKLVKDFVARVTSSSHARQNNIIGKSKHPDMRRGISKIRRIIRAKTHLLLT